MYTISEKFADFIVDLSYKNLPEDIVSITKDRIIDMLGAILGGSFQGDISDKLKGVIMSLGGKEQSSIFGKGQKTTTIGAVICNSAFGHALELDDGHRFAGVHAGTVVVPVALAIGESLGSSGKDIIAGVVAGYDVIYRIAKNITPSHIEKGFHPTGCTGVYGSAAAAAKLMSLSKEQTVNALGLAGLQSAGLMEIVRSGQGAKGMLPAHAAQAGVFCALLAAAGIEGPRSILDGKNGFLNSMAENIDFDAIVDDLGRHYEITDTYTKLYPTCRHMHQPIENIMALKDENGIDYHDVEKIVVKVSQIAYNLAGQIVECEDASQARFSIPTAAALTLKYGDVNLSLLSGAAVNDTEIKELAKKVTVVIDKEVENLLPKVRCAIVDIVLRDGTVYSKRGTVLKGSPDAPVDFNVLANKFAGCSANVLSSAKIDKAIELVRNLENLKNLGDLIKNLVP